MSGNVRWFGIVFFLPMLLCPPLVRGNEPVNLEEIVVTATRSEIPLSEVGSSITVVTREEIEQRKKAFVSDLLRDVPALDVVRSGGPGGPTSVFIRGARSEHTLVLLDGVRMNDPSTPGSTFDFANLTTENIERIEILRGPQSTLYGSDAIGGVINIITRQGEGKPNGSVSAEGGSFSTAVEKAGISGGAGPLHYSFGLTRMDTAGISTAGKQYGNREKDGYHSNSVSTRLGVKPAGNFDLECSVRYLDTRSDMDNGGGADQDDPNSVARSQQLSFRTQARLSLFNDLWEQRLGFSLTDLKRNYRNDIDITHPFDMDLSHYKGQTVAFDWQHTLRLHKTNTLTLGMETRKEKALSDYYSESLWGPYSAVFPKSTARTTGYYLQDRISLWDSWFTTVGIRLDDHSRFGTQATCRFTSSWLVKQTGTRIKGSYGTGFKAPSLYQLLEPTYGNRGLKPEKSTGWDAGIEQALFDGRVELGATWFSNEFKDMIEFDSGASRYLNISRALSRGIELTTTVRPREGLELHMSYTRTKAEDKTTGKKLLRRPKDKFALNADYRFLEKGNANLGIAYVGKRADYDYSTWPAERVSLGGYLLVNLAASYDVTRWMQLYARVDNLFDKRYEEVKGYGVAGLSAYGGVKVSF